MRATVRLCTIVLICATSAIAMVCLGRASLVDVHELLYSDAACRLPCYLGIHPGSTLYTKAVDILDVHPWVGEVIVSPELRNSGTGFVFIRWSGMQPSGIATSLVSTLWVEEGLVLEIRIPTRIAFAWYWLDARSTSGTLIRLSERSFRYIQPLRDGASIHLTLQCPFRRGDLWNRAAELRFGSTRAVEERFVVSAYPRSRPCLNS